MEGWTLHKEAERLGGLEAGHLLIGGYLLLADNLAVGGVHMLQQLRQVLVHVLLVVSQVFVVQKLAAL